MAIIGISGKIGSGKDTVGTIIQYLTSVNTQIPYLEWINSEYNYKNCSDWEIRKFADKLKNIVCLLIGCTREQLEDINFKNKELGKEWYIYKQYDKSIDKWIIVSKDYYTRLNHVKSAKFKISKLTPRILLQLLGTEAGRDIIHPNIWVNSLFVDYTGNAEFNGEPKMIKGGFEYPLKNLKFPNWVITDMRFPNELNAVTNRKGITIRVERYDITNQGMKNIPHTSETALDNAKFDYWIDNFGTIEDLINKVKEILIKEKIL